MSLHTNSKGHAYFVPPGGIEVHDGSSSRDDRGEMNTGVNDADPTEEEEKDESTESIQPIPAGSTYQVSSRKNQKHAAKKARTGKLSMPAVQKEIDKGAESLVRLNNQMRDPTTRAALVGSRWASPVADDQSPNSFSGLRQSSEPQSPSPSSTARPASWTFDSTIDLISDTKGYSNKERKNAKALMEVDLDEPIMSWADKMRANNEELRGALHPQYSAKKAALAARQDRRREIVCLAGKTREAGMIRAAAKARNAGKTGTPGQIAAPEEIEDEDVDAGSEYDPDE